MVNLEWAHVIIGVVSAIGGAGAGLVVGVWKVAHIEQSIRLDYARDLADVVQDMKKEMSEMSDPFDETLKALRQKINDVELESHRGFVAKGDFDDFRKEYREDMRDLKQSISQIPRTH